ncbi:peptide chain release factor subunit 3 [Sarotherodon galilaeus]
MSTNDSTSCSAVDSGVGTGSPYKALEMFFIAMVTGSLSFVTVTGNILVMLSIKVNPCADLIIGVFSMNLYTVYIIVGYWPLGPVVCDLWLALDYVVSNASVMNLLIISFDRYFCVTKPLTYPTRRTTKMAGLMIAAAWILSFILWAPAILFWQFIVGQRTVPPGECYIQFLSNPAVTFGTAIAAFYLPVIIMTVLYIHISLASRSRVTKTIFAILLAFIITWTPYNVMVLISTFCQSCVPDTVWAIGYWLCYVNSTINPACYALCNATFKKTFKNLLLCQYKNIGTR